MELYKKLNEIEKNNELNKNLKLKVKGTDGKSYIGYFYGYTDALNNEPEITQLEILPTLDSTSIMCIFETEIKEIEVVN